MFNSSLFLNKNQYKYKFWYFPPLPVRSSCTSPGGREPHFAVLSDADFPYKRQCLLQKGNFV